tara:strand:+ start:1805 stop:2554 length:750 start_codon:yes stop_codon:yes gene_type:complete
MAKYTLLELTQAVLTSIGGDQVNSISDTTESTDVAETIRGLYNNITTATDLRELNGLFTLDATSSTTPTVMTKPATVDTEEWIKYNSRIITDTVDRWEVVNYLEPEDFIKYNYDYDLTASTTGSFTLSVVSFNTKIYYENNRGPKYWTTFDDYYIVFDAYDIGVDSNLQQSKTQCWGKLNSAFSLTDSFVPPLDRDQFDLLLNEAKAACSYEIRQLPNERAEAKVRKGWIRTQKERPSQYPNYGRKGKY